MSKLKFTACGCSLMNDCNEKWFILSNEDSRAFICVVMWKSDERNLILFTCVDKRYHRMQGIREVVALFDIIAVSFNYLGMRIQSNF